MILQHPGQPNPNEPRNFERMVTFGPRRDAGTGFMAYSERIGPGVVLIPEANRLTDSVRQMAVELRDEGFTVLAPDLFGGEVSDLNGARRRGRALLRLRAAADLLVDNWHPRVGVVGFSTGAALAATLAQDYHLEATVLYYALLDGPIGRWSGPVLVHHASEDELLTPEVARTFTDALQDAGVDVESIVHPGAGHSFANRDVPAAFNEGASVAAWDATVDFLRYHLA